MNLSKGKYVQSNLIHFFDKRVMLFLLLRSPKTIKHSVFPETRYSIVFCQRNTPVFISPKVNSLFQIQINMIFVLSYLILVNNLRRIFTKNA